jgi:hypothetical protein
VKGPKSVVQVFTQIKKNFKGKNQFLKRSHIRNNI